MCCVMLCFALLCFTVLGIDIDVGADDVDFLPIQADSLCAEHD